MSTNIANEYKIIIPLVDTKHTLARFVHVGDVDFVSALTHECAKYLINEDSEHMNNAVESMLYEGMSRQSAHEAFMVAFNELASEVGALVPQLESFKKRMRVQYEYHTASSFCIIIPGLKRSFFTLIQSK